MWPCCPFSLSFSLHAALAGEEKSSPSKGNWQLIFFFFKRETGNWLKGLWPPGEHCDGLASFSSLTCMVCCACTPGHIVQIVFPFHYDSQSGMNQMNVISVYISVSTSRPCWGRIRLHAAAVAGRPKYWDWEGPPSLCTPSVLKYKYSVCEIFFTDKICKLWPSLQKNMLTSIIQNQYHLIRH